MRDNELVLKEFEKLVGVNFYKQNDIYSYVFSVVKTLIPEENVRYHITYDVNGSSISIKYKGYYIINLEFHKKKIIKRVEETRYGRTFTRDVEWWAFKEFKKCCLLTPGTTLEDAIEWVEEQERIRTNKEKEKLDFLKKAYNMLKTNLNLENNDLDNLIVEMRNNLWKLK